MENAQQIALAFPRGAHQEGFIEGVFRYASDHNLQWSYTVAPESLSLSVDDLVGWHGDGVLAALDTPEHAESVAALEAPVVNISSALRDSPVPRSMVDNLEIGRVAAGFLVSRGFRSFAFYGLKDVEYSKRRWMGFASRLEESGFSSERHLATATFSFRGDVWIEQHKELGEWLASLPSPCGIFAVSDHRARHILDAASAAGLQCPRDLAVMGVDNEQIICEHVSPTLSSVARNNLLEGYRASELLHRMMRREPLDEYEQLVPPLEVVERASTDEFAVADARLKRALEFIAEHSSDPITVDELTDHLQVSRRWLEYAFREAIGESPYQYLQRQRLLKAKEMLTSNPASKISSVAKHAGFTSEKQFRVSFARAFGVTPGEFRRLRD